jgi:hypothetical protein
LILPHPPLPLLPPLPLCAQGNEKKNIGKEKKKRKV